MNKFHLIIALLFLATNSIQSQENQEFTTVKTKTGDVKVPGTWTQLNTMDDSGQTYLKNKEEIIIAIAQNPKKAYSFFKANKSDFENVKEFYKWDADYRKENNFKIDKIKENPKQEFYVSDDPEKFRRIGGNILNKNIKNIAKIDIEDI